MMEDNHDQRVAARIEPNVSTFFLILNGKIGPFACGICPLAIHGVSIREHHKTNRNIPK